LLEGKENTYWNAARDGRILEAAKFVQNDLKASNFFIYGELCGEGIQKNLYQLKGHRVFIFDIKVDRKWMSHHDVQEIIDSVKIKHEIDLFTVPELFRGKLRDYLEDRTVKEASNGESILFKRKREGIVIKPVDEQHSYVLSGRLIIKQRSPEFLASEKG